MARRRTGKEVLHERVVQPKRRKDEWLDRDETLFADDQDDNREAHQNLKDLLRGD
jgi:hypothetical protein